MNFFYQYCTGISFLDPGGKLQVNAEEALVALKANLKFSSKLSQAIVIINY